jgi:hypothetical protein
MSFRPSSSYNETSQQAPLKDSQFSSTHNSQDMLASYRRSAPADATYTSPSHLNIAGDSSTTHTAMLNLEKTPDPLTRAFNEAIKPYLEKIELLQQDLEDAQQQVQQYEAERAEMHAWIDKRGLRPGKIQFRNTIASIALTLTVRPDSTSCCNYVFVPSSC